mgnify:FL=1
MFADAGVYKPCGIFTKGHFILILATVLGIFVALKHSVGMTKEKVYKVIKKLTITMCIIEIFKIIYSISKNSLYDVNTYLPLYYCSMLLYAGLLSSFCKGTLKRVGDVCLATGSIIGGIVFIIYPSTTLPTYPAFHFLSIHSFLFHGIMVYLGILINKTHYIELKKEDLKYFASLVGIMSIIAFAINGIFNSNLMFISQNFEVFPINAIYNLTNGGITFSLIMALAQMTLPFYAVYYVVEKIRSMEEEKVDLENASMC